MEPTEGRGYMVPVKGRGQRWGSRAGGSRGDSDFMTEEETAEKEGQGHQPRTP